MIEDVSRLAGKRVMIIGDVMLDHYVVGEVERISPEAPVPVVRVGEEDYRLGGAGNVARNVVALGGKPLLVSPIGDDQVGGQVSRLCSECGFKAELVVVKNRPTTRKTRILAGNQQVVRVDRESADPLNGSTVSNLINYLREQLPNYEVVILSDYGKGVISTEFISRFNSLLESLDERPVILVDPKTRNYDHYHGVDMLTPNSKEAGEGAGIEVIDQASIKRAGSALFERLSCKNLLITLGSGGMALFTGPDKVQHIPTVARKVYDVTGAGDTVIATIALALAAGHDLLKACVLANHAAGIVVAQIGAATATPERLAEAMKLGGDFEISRW